MLSHFLTSWLIVTVSVVDGMTWVPNHWLQPISPRKGIWDSQIVKYCFKGMMNVRTSEICVRWTFQGTFPDMTAHPLHIHQPRAPSVFLTSPSQLLMATEASGMSVTSPVKTQSPWMRSLVFSSKSSCHSTKAPGATSLLLARRRRWSSFPNTVTLKNKCWADGGVTKGMSGAPRATLLLMPEVEAAAPAAAAALLLPLPAETTWEMYRPWESVLNGTIRPYSLNFPESFSDGTDSIKWESHSQTCVKHAHLENHWQVDKGDLGLGGRRFNTQHRYILALFLSFNRESKI